MRPHPYPFVGRRRETACLRAELEAGRSVVLTGIWGIGRTALAKRVAEEMAREWLFVFVDFERAPGQVWRDLFAAIFPRPKERLRTDGGSAKWMRYRMRRNRFGWGEGEVQGLARAVNGVAAELRRRAIVSDDGGLWLKER